MNYHQEMLLEALVNMLARMRKLAETPEDFRAITVAECAIAMQEVNTCDAYIRAEHAKLVEALQ